MSEARLAHVDGVLPVSAALPRSNGELVFDEPWQGRALGMAVVALERAHIPWTEFSNRLAEAVRLHGYDANEPAATALRGVAGRAGDDARGRRRRFALSVSCV